MEKRDNNGILDGSTSGGNNYMASSPAALYDNQRNMRNIDNKLNQREKLLNQHHRQDDNDGDVYINEVTGGSSQHHR